MTRKSDDPNRRTQALFRKLEKLPEALVAHSTPEAVHQLRTTIRRVETLIAASSTNARNGRLLKQMKNLRRRAGRVRDIDVQLAALRNIRAGHKRERLEVRHALEQLRKKRSRKLVKNIEEELDSGLRRRMRNTAAALTTPAATDPAVHNGNLAMALDRFAKLAAGYPPLRPENLHAFRMACKRIRYLAEMEPEHPTTDAVLSQFKRIQDAVGEWHDWLNLAQTTEDVLARPNSPLLAAVRAGRQAKFNEALRITGDAKARLLSLRLASKTQEPRPVMSAVVPFRKQAVAS